MNCNFVRSRLSCYVDGELPGDEMFALRRHLEGCTSCRQQYESDRGIKHLLAAMPEREASADLESRLLAAVREANSTPIAGTVWPTSRMAFVLAAAAVTMFCAMMLRGSEPDSESMDGNEIALDQDWNNARSVFPASNLPAGLEGP
jgi:anti-sigma factor (TIGR02949 family)